MVNTRKHRKVSRKNRKCSRKTLTGGRRRRAAGSKFTIGRRVGRPLGVLVTGASNTVVTAGKSALNVFDTLVKGVVKTGKRGIGAVDRTVRAAVTRRNRKARKERKH
jgi:hypothetical protein